MRNEIITGHTIVMVKVAGGEVAVRRGETLPAGVSKEEYDRLVAVGAFDPAPVADLAGQGAALVPGSASPAPEQADTAEREADLARREAEFVEGKAALDGALQAQAESLGGREIDVAEREQLASAGETPKATKKAPGPRG